MRHHIGMACTACGSDDHEITDALESVKSQTIPNLANQVDILINLFKEHSTNPVAYAIVAQQLDEIAMTIEGCRVLATLHGQKALKETSCQN
jgi:hypothetical protein